MRAVLSIVAVLALVMSFSGCKKEKAATVDFNNFNSKFSYAVGYDIGRSLKDAKSMVDLKTVMKGIEDAMNGATPILNEQEAMQVKQEAFMKMQSEMSKVGQEKEKTFLAENAKKPGVITTPSGLQYQILKEGTGPKATAASTVSVHYVGTLLDGKEFDSSIKRGQPAEFPVGGVIPGWVEGLQLMSKGAKYKFFIPAALAYGERGAGQQIPPFSTLIFEVELLEIK